MAVNKQFIEFVKFKLIEFKLKSIILFVLLHKKYTFVQFIVGEIKFERNLILIVRIIYITD